MGRPSGQSKYSDRLRYCVSVFWLHGMTQTLIARHASRIEGRKISVSSVRSIVASSAYSDRSVMGNSRQTVLTFLKEHRMDGGILRDHVFTAEKLEGRQK